MSAAMQRAQNPSAAEGAFQNQIAGTLQGDYLNSNPYLDATFNQASDRLGEQFQKYTNPAIQATFGSAGRTGSGLQGEVFGQQAQQLGDQMNRLATNIYGGNYQQERARQMQAAGMAPSAVGMDWNNIAQMGQIGGMVQNQAQRQIQDEYQRWQATQAQPDEALARYLAAVSGNVGGVSTTQSGNNPLAGAIGGGLTGWQIGGPWGAGIGAIGGLLS